MRDAALPAVVTAAAAPTAAPNPITIPFISNSDPHSDFNPHPDRTAGRPRLVLPHMHHAEQLLKLHRRARLWLVLRLWVVPLRRLGYLLLLMVVTYYLLPATCYLPLVACCMSHAKRIVTTHRPPTTTPQPRLHPTIPPSHHPTTTPSPRPSDSFLEYDADSTSNGACDVCGGAVDATGKSVDAQISAVTDFCSSNGID